MPKINDLYTYFEQVPIVVQETKLTIGMLVAEYQIREYVDVRNLLEARSYWVTCKQRIIVAHDGISALGGTVNRFENYPVLLKSSIQISATPQGAAAYLVEYAPKTLNAAVTSNQGTGDTNGKTAAVTNQETSGSSYSATNSYEVSVSLGFFGDQATGGVTGSYGYSDTSTDENSASQGRSVGQNVQQSSSSSDAMTIKDWASFASLDKHNQTPRWVWSQQYPWSPIEYQDVINNRIVLPDFVKLRLWDKGTKIYPPSHLSLFGINFVSQARWTMTVPQMGGPENETVRFKHCIKYFSASHSIADEDLKVELHDAETFEHYSQPIDAVMLALDPINMAGSNNGAIVGFVRSQFVAHPDAGSGFRIKSGANNLMIRGTGFATQAGDDSPMGTDFSWGGQAQMDVRFKVVDPKMELTLFIKHWKTTPTGCQISVAINGATPIIRHIDAADAGAGSNNITAITLRNRDYASPEFFDYLGMGLNVINITLAPLSGSALPCGYAIRALAIA